MKSEPSILKQISVASKIELSQTDKDELWSKIETRIEAVPTRKRVSLKLVTLATTIPFVTLGLVGYTLYKGESINGTPVPTPPPLNRTQVNQVASTIYSITTPYGEYVRKKQFVKLPRDEVAYSKADAQKPEIKEIVLPYGIFIKVRK